MMKCFYCKNPAVTFRPYSGEYLCKTCFSKSIERKVQRTINKYSLLEETDTVAVAVSGGKDSLTLLTILSKLERRFRETKLIAVTIDEGIRNYREESLRFAKLISNKLEIPHKIYSFKELFGYNFDDVIGLLRDYGFDKSSPCSYCGLLRRTALNTAAKAVGATKLATAHNLDDEAQTVIMNFLRADYMRVLRTGAKLEKIHSGFVPRIKPLIEVPEREIILYAYFNNLPLHSQTCPYAQDAFRNDVRAFLNKMEVTRPEVKYNILRVNERLRTVYKSLEGELDLGVCVECGDPSSQELCKKCQLIKILDQLKDVTRKT
ncbi:MAG: TIGR00269 family protein [Candidatus Odinarchaeota archaeon]